MLDVLDRDVLVEVDEGLPAAAPVVRERGRRHAGCRLKERVEPSTFLAQPPPVGATAEPQRERGLGAGHRARELGARRVVEAHDRARRVHAGGEAVRDEATGDGVVARSCAGLEQQRAGGYGPAADAEQVAVEPLLGAGDRGAVAVHAREHNAGDVVAAGGADDGHACEQGNACSRELRAEPGVGRVGAQIGHRGDVDPRGVKPKGGLQPAIARRGDDGVRTGADRVERRHAARSCRQHHAREVIVGENQRLLDGAGRGDMPARTDLVQRVALPDRHETVEVAQRGSAGEDLHAGRAGLLREVAGAVVAALGEQRAARLDVVVDEHDIGTQLCGAQRGRQARCAPADHEHVAVTTPVLGSPLALVLALREPAEPGGVAQHLLVQRPQAARADERLVVEADRREGTAEAIGRPHHVEAQRRPGVLVLDAHAVQHRLAAAPDARGALDLEERVGALATAAQLAARAVVLEAARQHSSPRGHQCRGDRVAVEAANGVSVERERHRPCAVDPLGGLRLEPVHVVTAPAAAPAAASASAGSAVQSTSLVRVSRSARNQARQPERWTHHSR